MTVPTAINTGTSELVAQVEDGVATITLSRPHRKNALSNEILEAFGPLLHRMNGDPEVGAVIITGAGTAFCAGGDVTEFAESGGVGRGSAAVDPEAVRTQQQQQRAIIGGLRAMRQPVLAALPGAAAGAGIGLALAADLRIGTPNTVMASAFVGVGLPGDFGTSWQLQQIIGRGRTAEMMLLGERIEAADCQRLGLLNWIVQPDALTPHSFEIALRLARGPRRAISYAKKNLTVGETMSLLDAMDVEAVLHHECGITADHRDALSAWLERKRAASDETVRQ